MPSHSIASILFGRQDAKLPRSPMAVSEAPLEGIMDFTGVCGRFRYSDLKEATGYGI